MISIIVPCYNCQDTLDRCVESLINQTYKNIEIILVDDGSTDATPEICEELKKIDKRISVLHQDNGGLMNAWKNGVKLSSGEYIMFCDSDDYVETNMVEIMENKVAEYDAEMVVGGATTEYEDGTIKKSDNILKEGYYNRDDIELLILPRLLNTGGMESSIILVSRWGKLYKRELITRKTELLDEEVSIGEDELTTFVNANTAKSLYCFNDYFPYHYMRNNSSMIGKYDEGFFGKILILRNGLDNASQMLGYKYKSQIDDNFVSNVLLCMKKDICRNQDKNYFHTRKRLKRMRENDIFDRVIRDYDLKSYEIKSRVFAWLVKKKCYFALYSLTNLMDYIGFGKS